MHKHATDCLQSTVARFLVGPESQAGFFCTNISKSDKYGCDRKTEKLRLFIVGDIGGQEHNGEHSPTDGQRSVAKLMGELATKNGLNLVLNLGDNFYENGVTEKDVEKRFNTNFLKVFGTVGSETVPWYTIAGNRDYKANGANISPQIEKTAGKWTFPAPYYAIHYNFGKARAAVRVRFVMIDTVILCGQNRKAFRELKESAEEKVQASKKHFEWLTEQLHLAEKQRVDFLFVAGHYPLYLTDGDRSFTCAKRLQELLLQHRVSAYFSGHEHNLKHLSIEGDVPRIVSGAGSRMESATYENHVPKQFEKHLRLWLSRFN
uniref:Metallophos domain-containing protein n=1 Tax=Globodera pallida TaxID=36090 RepID=A0A183BPW1_GLOPA